MRLLLIRHGQTSSNVAHALDTAVPGADLTDLGREQAAAIPAGLVGLFGPDILTEIDEIVVSPLVRTQQTAAPLAATVGLTPQVRDGVREIPAGYLEMRSDRASIEEYVDVVFSWNQTPDRALPGGETGTQVLARFDAVVAELAERGRQCPVIVSHGAIIRVWAGFRCPDIGLNYSAGRLLTNTGLIALERDPTDSWRLLAWTEHALGGPEFDDVPHSGPAAEPGATTPR